jgi:hypothetical protein
MPKRIKPQDADHERMVSDKFRTTPIKSTIKHITGLPRSAILYKCAASTFWQFRVHLEGKPRKRSTKQEEIAKAEHEAKKIYAEMLAQVTSGEITVQPTTRNSLQHLAKSLWAKNETRIKNKELNEDKVTKDTYVFERHIKPKPWSASWASPSPTWAEAIDEERAVVMIPSERIRAMRMRTP